MDTLHEIPMRSFTRSKTVEQLIAEQAVKIPDSFDGYLIEIMPSVQTPEAWNARLEQWRNEDRVPNEP